MPDSTHIHSTLHVRLLTGPEPARDDLCISKRHYIDIHSGAWRETELVLDAEHDHDSPYVDVEVRAEFRHDTGAVLRRPAFWDGGRTWRVRFASPLPSGRWTWRSASSVEDPGLAGATGSVEVEPGAPARTAFDEHGFWRDGPGTAVRADLPALAASMSSRFPITGRAFGPGSSSMGIGVDMGSLPCAFGRGGPAGAQE